MTHPNVRRTLVKSPPELWAEISDAEFLARHLGSFGEIRITRLQPETTVAWEGDRASGTVELEASGWGTRVTLTAEPAAPPPAPAATPAGSGDARGRPDGLAGRRRRLLAWLRGRRRTAVAPAPNASPAPAPAVAPVEPAAAEAALAAVLDDLGTDSRRPAWRG